MAAEPEDDLDLKPADAGSMFRAEMFTTNLLLGYWKHLVAAVVVGLLAVLIYGQYADWHRRSQRTTTSQIATALAELPAELPLIPERIAAGEAVDPALLEKTGDTLVAIANGASGPARVEALLQAAELFRIAANPEKQREALAGAAGEAEGVLAFAAEGALANLELEQGQGDAAVSRLQRAMQAHDGYLAEQAALDLGLALEHLGRSDEAGRVYADFLTRWPDSPRADGVRQRQAQLGGGAG